MSLDDILNWVRQTTEYANSIAPISAQKASSYSGDEYSGIRIPTSAESFDVVIESVKKSLQDSGLQYDIPESSESASISDISEYFISELKNAALDCAQPLTADEFTLDELLEASKYCPPEAEVIEYSVSDLLNAICASDSTPGNAIDQFGNPVVNDIEISISDDIGSLTDLVDTINSPDISKDSSDISPFIDHKGSSSGSVTIPDGIKNVLSSPSDLNPTEANDSLSITVDDLFLDSVSTEIDTKGSDILSECSRVAIEMTQKLQPKILRLAEIKSILETKKLEFRYAELENVILESIIAATNTESEDIDKAKEVIQSYLDKLKSATQFGRIIETMVSLEIRNQIDSVNIALTNFLKIPVNLRLSSFIDPDKGFEESIRPYSTRVFISYSSGNLLYSFVEKASEDGVLRTAPLKLQKSLDSIDRSTPDATKDILSKLDEMTSEIDGVYNTAISNIATTSLLFVILTSAPGKTLDLSNIKYRYSVHNKKYLQLKNEYESIILESNQLESDIESFKSELETALSAIGCNIPDPEILSPPGSDLNFKTVSNNPIVTDYLWWVRFCSLANIINLIPVHWPVGILIPIPFGLLKIPCPIIWSPLAVIPTISSLTVVLFGQCGILPCPFVYFMHFFPGSIGPITPESSWFTAAIRPMKQIVAVTENKALNASPKVNMFGASVEVDPAFTKTMPIIKDDLPVWERLSIDNAPFVGFLWKWCNAGKRAGGFFENPF